MTAALYAMTSGECRWIGRPDIHVYRWSPGRADPLWKVRTVASTGSVWDDAGWSDAATVIRQIETLLKEEPRHVA